MGLYEESIEFMSLLSMKLDFQVAFSELISNGRLNDCPFVKRISLIIKSITSSFKSVYKN